MRGICTQWRDRHFRIRGRMKGKKLYSDYAVEETITISS
jgi:hypothetical protein